MDNIDSQSELALTLKGRKPPYPCPVCQKEYRSVTGILYHLGKTGPPCKGPRCMLGEETPQGSPKPPGSPGSSIRRKGPRRDLTWAEAQRLVELEFEHCYKRLEIDHNLDVSLHSDEEGEESIDLGNSDRRGSTGTGPRTPLRRGKGASKGSKGESQQNRGKWSSKSKNKGKRKSKLKTPGKEGEDSSSLPRAEVLALDSLEFTDAPTRESSYYRFVEQSAEDLDETIEYDMDEEDYQWLSLVNEDRKSLGLTAVPQEVFEILMDRLEKECFFESHMAGPGTESNNMYNIDENAVCCICNDGECHNTNAILFCDMCNLAVHQECYGVPYIPEGQWLCRRCLQSPSRGVDCVLCPNKGGGFKQTVDSKWAHVICAIWIPEVQFANPVFLEPIDGINDIPPARWKLTCYICHKRMGACIQCTKANCYVAFHVTCAQLAGLHMKVELIKGGEVRKTAYCDTHTPPSVKRKKERIAREKAAATAAATEGKQGSGEGDEEKEMASDNDEHDEQAGEGVKGEDGEESDAGDAPARQDREGSDDIIRKCHRLSGVKKHPANQPVVNIPYVPQHRLERIVSRVSLHKKSQFIPKLVSYWKLKRQSRNGVPLLRRLQASSKGQRSTANLTEEEREVLAEQLTHWKNLRHDLERARLLIELIRKREKLKKEHLKMMQSIKELQMKPLNTLIRRMIERLRRKDPADIFAEPVSVDEVPDYLDVIKTPMDFTTMKKKLEANEYHTLNDFKKDFYLVWHNATIYNHKDTIYYRAALRIKEAGLKMIEDVSRLLESAMVDPSTGVHNPEVQEPPPLTPSTIADVLKDPILFDDNGDNDDKVFTSSGGSRNRRLSSTASLSLDEQVEILQEKLEMVPMQYTGFAKKRKEKNLKREIQALKRQLKQERKISESDEHGTPPPRRQRAASIPRNAEELACHVLHGSLRLTPSRQQILSHSGIRLEERAASQESGQQQQANQQGLPHPLQTTHHTPGGLGESGLLQSHTAAGNNVESATSHPNIKSPRGISAEGIESNTDSDDENSSESSSSSSEDEEEEEERGGGTGKEFTEIQNSRSMASPQKRARGRHKEDLAISRERGRVNRQPRQQFKSRRRASGGGSTRLQTSRSKRKPKAPPRIRLDSGGAYSSTSETEFPVNGTTTATTTCSTLGPGGREIGRISREMSKCSSVYETANEGYVSIEGEQMTSPLSDSMTGGRIPKATGIEELTARNLSSAGQKQSQGQVRGKKRKRSSTGGASSEKSRKKSRLESGSSADGGHISKSKTINGLVNGSGAGMDIKPLDLVWAKCRGYPPYPALVIDPDIPPKGLNINGERIQAPSDEVMELRDKNATAIYLVRFFDGRRTWQWLPPDKIEPLGVDTDYDLMKVSQSGNSKRSVKEAYQRAKKYLARKSKSTSKLSTASDNDDSDSDDKDSSSDSSNSDS